MDSLRIFLLLPFFSVFTQVGIASSFTQIKEIFNSEFFASTFIAITPLVSMIIGPLWGKFLSKYGEKRTYSISLFFWGIIVMLISFFLYNPILSIILRAVQGFFDPVFYNISLTGVSKSSLNIKNKSKFYGYIEIMGSLGAILGPLILGSFFIYYPKQFLFLLSIIVLFYLFFTFKKIKNFEVDVLNKKESKKFSLLILLATFYGISVLISIVALQVVLPIYVEQIYENAILGKVIASLFSVGLMIGNFAKHKLIGIKKIMPIFTGIILFISYLFIDNSIIFLSILFIGGIFLGLSLTMSSEYASVLSKGFENTGMSFFSSLRISGNIFGPYLAAMAIPNLFILLSALTIVSTGLLFSEKD